MMYFCIKAYVQISIWNLCLDRVQIQNINGIETSWKREVSEKETVNIKG